jgi:hypothetical protein
MIQRQSSRFAHSRIRRRPPPATSVTDPVNVPAVPKPATPLVTSRVPLKKMEPEFDSVPTAQTALPMISMPVLVSAPVTSRSVPGSRSTVPSLTSPPVVDTAALSRSVSVAPAPIEASPVSALFEPRAVLSSMKALFPVRCKFAPLARLVICPLANSIALSPVSSTLPLKTPAAPNPALPAVTSRSAWLARKPVREIEPELSSDATVTLSDAERSRLPMVREPLLVSAPAKVRLDPPSRSTKSRRTCPSLTSEPVVDTAALLWIPKIAPAPIEASPVKALFDPSVVLSSTKASFPFRCNCA